MIKCCLYISKFLDWMYPHDGGGDLFIEDSALGVFILWTTWSVSQSFYAAYLYVLVIFLWPILRFAFNCGSTESVESNTSKQSCWSECIVIIELSIEQRSQHITNMVNMLGCTTMYLDVLP